MSRERGAMKLSGKVAIVTGAASGMGKAVAELFAQEGAKVVVADINEQGGAETVARIKSAGGKAVFVRCDISSSKEVQQLISKTLEAFGGLDILYNNAAMNRRDTGVSEAVAEVPEEYWNATINTNLTGYYLCSKYALAEMLKKGRGVIINVASTQGLFAGKNLGAYIASKHGVVGLTKSMALDYGPRGIRVNAICPGSIDTPRFRFYSKTYGKDHDSKLHKIPLGRLGTPEEFAKVALFFASDDSSFVTGQALVVDGGRTLSVSLRD